MLLESALFLTIFINIENSPLPDGELVDEYYEIQRDIRNSFQNSNVNTNTNADNATVPPCWGLNDVGDVWVGTCVDVVEVCGGSMAIAVVDLVGVPEEGMKFGRGGGDGFPMEKAQCHEYGEEEEDLDGAVSEVFERLGLPVPVVVSEPEGLSLVNVENYVRGVVDDFDTTVELLDQDVRIRAYPTVWSWDMGDGTTYERTAGSGGFPDGGVLHPFYRVGEYGMSVTVTWEGHYQVEGSNTWLTVNGTGYTTSEPEHLAVEERRAYLGTPPDDPDE